MKCNASFWWATLAALLVFFGNLLPTTPTLSCLDAFKKLLLHRMGWKTRDPTPAKCSCGCWTSFCIPICSAGSFHPSYGVGGGRGSHSYAPLCQRHILLPFCAACRGFIGPLAHWERATFTTPKKQQAMSRTLWVEPKRFRKRLGKFFKKTESPHFFGNKILFFRKPSPPLNCRNWIVEKNHVFCLFWRMQFLSEKLKIIIFKGFFPNILSYFQLLYGFLKVEVGQKWILASQG